MMHSPEAFGGLDVGRDGQNIIVAQDLELRQWLGATQGITNASCFTLRLIVPIPTALLGVTPHAIENAFHTETL